jgi:hypothetical protein
MSIMPTRQGPEGRTIALIAGAAVGAILAVLAGVVLFPDRIGPLAYVAIGAIGAIVGTGLTILALILRRNAG